MGDNALETNPNHAKGEGADLHTAPSEEGIAALDSLAGDIVAKKNPAAHKDESSAPAPHKDESSAPALHKDESSAPHKDESSAPKLDESSAPAHHKDESSAPAPVVDPLDAIELPPNTKSKSAQAFGMLKEAAKKRISEMTTQLTEALNKITGLTQQVEEVKKTSGKLPPEVEKEISEARQFKASLDVENDPEFKKYDSSLTENTDSIYKKLEIAGYTKENIDRIKELGGPEAIDWEPLFPKLPPQISRFIQATLIDNERLRDQKQKAMTSAKGNAVVYTQQRTQREEKSVQDIVSSFTKDLVWLQPKEVPAGATAEERTAIEQTNAAVKTYQDTLKGYLGSRTPERYAELAVGTLIAHRFKEELAVIKATQTESDKKLAAVVKERDTLAAKLEAIKRAQVPRVRGDVTPPAPAKKKADVNVSGSEALDAHAREVVENRAE